jgi:hypothetical protein
VLVELVLLAVTDGVQVKVNGAAPTAVADITPVEYPKQVTERELTLIVGPEGGLRVTTVELEHPVPSLARIE